jgi:hypothetical protein
MLETLPSELFLSVCDYIEYEDILTLRQVNKRMYSFCNSFDSAMITSQLRHINETKCNMNKILNKYGICSKYSKSLDCNVDYNVDCDVDCDVDYVGNARIKFQELNDFSVFRKIHFEKQLKLEMNSKYKNNLNFTQYLILFKLYNYYRLLNIHEKDILHTITYNIPYNIKLFKQLAQNMYLRPLVKACFTYLINCHLEKKIILTMDDFYNISMVCANGYIISILFGNRILNLAKSDYINECRTQERYIKNIVRYKFLNKANTFLSINYNMIKIFLQNKNMVLLKYMKREELNFIYNNVQAAQQEFFRDQTCIQTKEIILKYTREYFS